MSVADEDSRDVMSNVTRDPSTIVRQIFAQIKSNGRQSRKGPRTSSGPLSDALRNLGGRAAQWTDAKWIVSRAEIVCRQTGRTGPSRCIDGTLVTAQLLSLIGTGQRCADCGFRTHSVTDCGPQRSENCMRGRIYRFIKVYVKVNVCLLYTSPSPRD